MAAVLLMPLLPPRTPRAAERMKDRSGRERVDVSSLGVMYCIAERMMLLVRMTISPTWSSWSMAMVMVDGEWLNRRKPFR